MGQLGQRIGLIHELGQRRGAEELLDRRDHRADVNQRLRGNHIHILRLQGHAFPDYPFHPGKADAELVLEQFAHRPDPAVAQMVDIVGSAYIVRQTVEIVDGSENIVDDNMLRHQLVGPLPRISSMIICFGTSSSAR